MTVWTNDIERLFGSGPVVSPVISMFLESRTTTRAKIIDMKMVATVTGDGPFCPATSSLVLFDRQMIRFRFAAGKAKGTMKNGAAFDGIVIAGCVVQNEPYESLQVF